MTQASKEDFRVGDVVKNYWSREEFKVLSVDGDQVTFGGLTAGTPAEMTLRLGAINGNDWLLVSPTPEAESRAETDHDPVNHPRHYTSHPSGVECITVVEHMPFNVGNAIKYLWRSDRKGGIEDLKKARWYVDREIARMEKLQP